VPDLSRWLGRSGVLLTSPAARCRAPGAEVEPALGPWDLGAWTGRPLAELDDLTAWRDDPAWCGHGGESLLALQRRVGDLLGRWHAQTGRRAAVTHAAVVRAAVTHVLRAPPEAACNLDVAPGSLTELHTTPTGWRVVRVGCRAE
jgi:broad specificity phosphatase PhoE